MKEECIVETYKDAYEGQYDVYEYRSTSVEVFVYHDLLGAVNLVGVDIEVVIDDITTRCDEYRCQDEYYKLHIGKCRFDMVYIENGQYYAVAYDDLKQGYESDVVKS